MVAFCYKPRIMFGQARLKLLTCLADLFRAVHSAGARTNGNFVVGGEINFWAPITLHFELYVVPTGQPTCDLCLYVSYNMFEIYYPRI